MGSLIQSGHFTTSSFGSFTFNDKEELPLLWIYYENPQFIIIIIIYKTWRNNIICYHLCSFEWRGCTLLKNPFFRRVLKKKKLLFLLLKPSTIIFNLAESFQLQLGANTQKKGFPLKSIGCLSNAQIWWYLHLIRVP